MIGIIAAAGALACGFMLHMVTSNPDARVSKTSRKSLFRGELKGTPAEPEGH